MATIPRQAPLAPGRGRRRAILAICCLSLFLVGMDVTIVNVALPSMRADLGASVSELQWTIDAYTLVVGSLLMLSASIGDRLGRRRVFCVGIVVFTAGSLLCALAPSTGLLFAARVIQAIGGSMLNPIAMGIIRTTFTDPRERARAIGVWGAVFGISLAVGPVLGGALTDGGDWRAIFWVNVPVGAVALALTLRYVPESRAARARRLDPVGQVLMIGWLAALLFAIIEAPEAGWASLRTIALFALGAVLIALLVAHELRHDEPLLEVRAFRSVPFSGATLAAVCALLAMGGFLFLNSIYLQDARGMSPLEAGLLTLPMAATMMIVSPLSGRLVGRYGARPSVVVAGIAMLAGGAMLVGVSATTPIPWLAGAYILIGAGHGLAQPPITQTAVSGLPPDQAGVAASIASTSRQLGVSLGVAIVGSVAVSHARDPAAIATATHAGWWIIAGCGAVLAGLGLTAMGRPRGGRTVAEPIVLEGAPRPA
ncbi:MAG: MFS transporter [Thermoleophilia bacterium]